ncbi:hypothetical protein BDW59DRAFT_158998 [Aspergillus cavernicola]|uniref:F-box domain-containing protein n=1 Tax=Aspergillus cavernicola TaxID=176166 RepID=A0ABR4INS5_9EURO
MSSAENSPHERALFNRLPTEILYLIFNYFAKGKHDHPAEFTAQEVSNMADSHSSANQTLGALALTSRRFHALVQPILYKTMYLFEGGEHDKLLQTAITTPQLAGLVTNVIFFEQDQSRNSKKKTRGYRSVYGNGARVPTSDSTDGPVSSQGSDKNATMSPRDGLRRLWSEVCRTNEWIERHWNRYTTTTRDAALDLVGLLCMLPNLKSFRFVGDRIDHNSRGLRPHELIVRGSPTPFQLIFTMAIAATISPLLPYTGLHLLRSLEDIEFNGLYLFVWVDFFRTIMILPRLRTLRLTYPTCLRNETLSPPNNRKSSTIRELRVSMLQLSPGNFSAILAAIESLEILHYEFYIRRDTPANAFDPFVSAVETHRSTLKELHFVCRSVTMEHGELGRFLLRPWCLADFPKLVILDIPDILLYNEHAINQSDLLRMLPPCIESLALAAWFHKTRALSMLEQLVIPSEQTRSLKKVTVLDKKGVQPDIWQGLLLISEQFTSRGISYDCTRGN